MAFYLKGEKMLIKIIFNEDEIAYIPENSLVSIVKAKNGIVSVITSKTKLEGKASDFFSVEYMEEDS